MKLYELMNEMAERLTGEEFGLAYDKLTRNAMSKEEIEDFVSQMVDEGRYPRSTGSLRFVMHRMHMILHGEAAGGVTAAQAKQWFTPSGPMEKYVLDRGELDAEDIKMHLQHAKEELERRPPPQTRRKPEEARNELSRFWKANQARLIPDTPQYREQIINSLVQGMPAEKAFEPYMA